MPNLTDTQTILLSTASRRADLALYPLDGVAAGARVTKAIAALIKVGFAEQRGEDGSFATSAGLAAIGVEPEAGQGSEPPQPAEPQPSKTASVLALLRRDEGATLAELVAATGWLPHSTRAALTGLRRKGHAITRFKRDDTTCYRIGAAR